MRLETRETTESDDSKQKQELTPAPHKLEEDGQTTRRQEECQMMQTGEETFKKGCEDLLNWAKSIQAEFGEGADLEIHRQLKEDIKEHEEEWEEMMLLGRRLLRDAQMRDGVEAGLAELRAAREAVWYGWLEEEARHRHARGVQNWKTLKMSVQNRNPSRLSNLVERMQRASILDLWERDTRTASGDSNGTIQRMREMNCKVEEDHRCELKSDKVDFLEREQVETEKRGVNKLVPIFEGFAQTSVVKLKRQGASKRRSGTITYRKSCPPREEGSMSVMDTVKNFEEVMKQEKWKKKRGEEESGRRSWRDMGVAEKDEVVKEFVHDKLSKEPEANGGRRSEMDMEDIVQEFVDRQEQEASRSEIEEIRSSLWREVEVALKEGEWVLDENPEDDIVEEEIRGKENDVEISRPTSIAFSQTESIDTETSSSLEEGNPRAIYLVQKKERTLWRDLEVVQTSGKLEDLTKEERTRQEAKFELMMSEASYLNMLNLLRSHYMRHIEKHIPQVLSQKDFNFLFKNILDIRAASAKFLKDLDEKWQEDVMLDGIYEVITKYASNDFKSYLNYCRNMEEMCSHQEELTRSNQEFQTLLEVLIKRLDKQKLSLNALLTSPMQRITKFPLLLKTILDQIGQDEEEYGKCREAYDAVCRIAHECNEMAAEKERTKEMLLLSQQIDFLGDVPHRPIVNKGRFVVAQADVIYYVFTEKSNKKEKMVLIFFNDLLLITKKRQSKHSSEPRLTVVDHCLRHLVEVTEVQNSGDQNLHAAVITLGNNCMAEKTSFVVAFTDKNQWQACRSYVATAATGATAENGTTATAEALVEVLAPQAHTTEEPEDQAMSIGDVIQLTGWCFGEIQRTSIRQYGKVSYEENHPNITK